ncbi:CRISPR-associated endonuclease Cas2 [Crossiella sp. SN42]|uniref:CRISPR-associated endonuclease Cas2 n=1 Tax=Crossiella sp. SN42 TaxID=2944808 RepID=UPI00207CF86D|nr:CRISPR-associated endonuclease Cas2 [Crossiella sp. SN42]MCO1575120.1 CRISPR-associated endonuclease Cas2 [Crossiella sp. SN42]
MRAPVVVVYDILDDRRRARVRAVLDPIAVRFQQSGWLLPAGTGETVRSLTRRLTEVTAPADRVRLHAPCPGCVAAARWLPTGSVWTLRPFPGWVVS